MATRAHMILLFSVAVVFSNHLWKGSNAISLILVGQAHVCVKVWILVLILYSLSDKHVYVCVCVCV